MYHTDYQYSTTVINRECTATKTYENVIRTSTEYINERADCGISTSTSTSTETPPLNVVNIFEAIPSTPAESLNDKQSSSSNTVSYAAGGAAAGLFLIASAGVTFLYRRRYQTQGCAINNCN